jgi:hypothetical protein
MATARDTDAGLKRVPQGFTAAFQSERLMSDPTLSAKHDPNSTAGFLGSSRTAAAFGMYSVLKSISPAKLRKTVQKSDCLKKISVKIWPGRGKSVTLHPNPCRMQLL